MWNISSNPPENVPFRFAESKVDGIILSAGGELFKYLQTIETPVKVKLKASIYWWKSNYIYVYVTYKVN